MDPAILAGHDRTDELVTLAELVSRDRPDIPAQGVPVSLLADVMRQVGCHRLIVAGYDPGHEETWFRQGILGDGWRSEEHTSELQSHSDLVCRLLLEKKKIHTEISIRVNCERNI